MPLPPAGALPATLGQAPQEALQPAWNSYPRPDVQGVPVNLDTHTRMRGYGPPEGLAHVEYPRDNPIVMNLSESSAPDLTQLGPLIMLRGASGPLGFTDLQQPFRAANAQLPPPNRTPLFQHSHPPLSLFDQQDPMADYPGFQMYGMGAPMGAGGLRFPASAGGMGVPMGSVGPYQHMNRFPTFIIIEAAGGESESEESVHPQGQLARGAAILRQDSSSSGQDTVFPTLLIQRRQQLAEEEQQEKARHRRRRHRAGGSSGSPRHAAGGRTPERRSVDHGPPRDILVTQPVEEQAVSSCEEKPNESEGATKEPEQLQKQVPAPYVRAQLPKAADLSEETVMRIDAITTTIPGLRKLIVFGRPISAPSGKDSIKAEAIRRARSQWDDPLEMNREHNRLLYDLPSVSTYDYASVWSNTTPSDANPSTQATTETDESRATSLPRSSAEGNEMNLLRPTVSMENITLLERAQEEMPKHPDKAPW
ncbi:hypothetical protein HPB47_020566 [Ixodes persulcatus]|uniref:Uncharacterized protein n=1 Tax=Ixodes persulcatus TaxID=34615 RepID=A0AC60QF77_IXOPE|nr:hypothetical protein HPB47_020566 [Ixodes persulcatus]